MSISFTVRLSLDNVIAMNTGIRRIGYAGNAVPGLITDYDIVGVPKPPAGTPDTQGRPKGLAEHFGLRADTVRNWLIPATERNARACVTLRDGSIPGGTNKDGTPKPARTYVGAIGRRVHCLLPDNLSGPADPLHNLRQRIFLASCLGVTDGLERIQITTGKERVREWPFTMLSDCLSTIKLVTSGEDGEYWAACWYRFTIKGGPGEWRLVLNYRDKKYAGQNYDEEVEDDTQDDPDHNSGPGCP